MASTTEETKTEEKTEEKATTYEGVVTGKYAWTGDDKPKDAEATAGAEITKYSYSDGKKSVSVYVELDGLDDVPDDKITTSVDGETKVELVIAAIGTPAKKRVLILNGLFAEITGAKATNKGKGKNMISLKLTKKEESPWPKLLATQGTGGGGGGDDDEDGGGGGGMMGGMGGGGMMGGMGGGMMGGMGGGGGMMGGMGGMMGGMGGGGGMDGGMGGMDIAEMMKGMNLGGAGGPGGPGGDDEGDEGEGDDDNHEEVD